MYFDQGPGSIFETISSVDLINTVDTLSQALDRIWRRHNPNYLQLGFEEVGGSPSISWQQMGENMSFDPETFLYDLPNHTAEGMTNYDQIDDAGREELFFFDLAAGYAKAKFQFSRAQLERSAFIDIFDPNKDAGLVRIREKYGVPIESWFRDPVFELARIKYIRTGIVDIYPEETAIFNF
jgi:hypothetical protein